jgi:hypothetical protein
MRIYVASSWRNQKQPGVVRALRTAGHEVYDFRNPAPGLSGFAWSEIDGGWQQWSPTQFRQALKHPIAREGFRRDREALESCDACVLVLPCGRSAHLEAGYAAARGADTFVLTEEPCEPELMYRLMSGIVCSVEELLAGIAELEGSGREPRIPARGARATDRDK